MIDWLLCVLVASLIADPRRDGWAPPLVLLVEYTFFVGFFALTPGMWLCRIRCVSLAHGGPIGPARAALRGLLLCLVVPALVLDGQGRGWHDRAAGSIVLSGRPRR
jgi:uncharacterized RDD family membrane protein YckC